MSLKTDYQKLKEDFGDRLSKIRADKKMSLRVLASNCELDSSQIGKIEKGVWNVQLSTIFELAKGLGIEAKELLDF